MRVSGNRPVSVCSYRHQFRDGPGGWLGWASNSAGANALTIAAGAAISTGPWWIDYNHAPPGGGYLSILFALHTVHGPNFPQQFKDAGGMNTFVAGGFPLDFTDARLTVEVCGRLNPRGARLLLLAQAKVGERYQNHILASQPITVSPEWSRTSLNLAPDDAQWISLGSRADRAATYSHGSIRDVLRCLNADIILVLYPLDVRPLMPLLGNRHALRAGEDYPVDPAYLPEGSVSMRSVEIEFVSQQVVPGTGTPEIRK